MFYLVRFNPGMLGSSDTRMEGMSRARQKCISSTERYADVTPLRPASLIHILPALSLLQAKRRVMKIS